MLINLIAIAVTLVLTALMVEGGIGVGGIIVLYLKEQSEKVQENSAQIAEELFIAETTVKKHVTHVYEKCCVSGA